MVKTATMRNVGMSIWLRKNAKSELSNCLHEKVLLVVSLPGDSNNVKLELSDDTAIVNYSWPISICTVLVISSQLGGNWGEMNSICFIQ